MFCRNHINIKMAAQLSAVIVKMEGGRELARRQEGKGQIWKYFFSK